MPDAPSTCAVARPRPVPAPVTIAVRTGASGPVTRAQVGAPAAALLVLDEDGVARTVDDLHGVRERLSESGPAGGADCLRPPA